MLGITKKENLLFPSFFNIRNVRLFWRNKVDFFPNKVVWGFWGGSVEKTTCQCRGCKRQWVQSLGWEDHLEKEMATHSSILAWRIPMDRGAWWATVHGVTKSRTQLKQLSTTKHSTAQRHLAAQMGGRDRVTKSSSAITQVGTPTPGENGKVGAARGVLLV